MPAQKPKRLSPLLPRGRKGRKFLVRMAGLEPARCYPLVSETGMNGYAHLVARSGRHRLWLVAAARRGAAGAKPSRDSRDGGDAAGRDGRRRAGESVSGDREAAGDG